MNIEKIERLRKALAAAHKEQTEIEQNRDARKAELMKELNATLAAEYDAARVAANEAVRDASHALDAALIEEGRQRLATMHQGVLIKWERKGRPWERRLPEPVAKGRLEVRDFDSQFPANRSWGIPSFGDVFIRLLSKDGKPGLRFESLNYSGKIPSKWLPEGERPAGAA